MLPKYYISKIPLIYSISAIFAHKSRYASFLHGVYGVTFAQVFCGEQMVACEQGHGCWLSWRPRYVQNSMLHIFFLTLKYCLSTVVWVLQNIGIGYRQWKIKTWVLVQKSVIDRVLPKIRSNLISRVSSLAQPTI